MSLPLGAAGDFIARGNARHWASWLNRRARYVAAAKALHTCDEHAAAKRVLESMGEVLPPVECDGWCLLTPGERAVKGVRR